MKEILTASGAVIHIDPRNATQTAMLSVALAAFGGSIAEVDIEGGKQ